MHILVANNFTNYNKLIRVKGDKPSVSTIQKHLRISKRKDCTSTTTFFKIGNPNEIYKKTTFEIREGKVVAIPH